MRDNCQVVQLPSKWPLVAIISVSNGIIYRPQPHRVSIRISAVNGQYILKGAPIVSTLLYAPSRWVPQLPLIYRSRVIADQHVLQTAVRSLFPHHFSFVIEEV